MCLARSGISHRDHGRSRVRITDTGGGLPEPVKEHLFTPFFTTKENGQGIGLTMVQEILLAHGCDFALENGRDGTAVFSVLFPQGG
jgi:two-component system nitrogen regulation sensor histidine kinase NtrY